MATGSYDGWSSPAGFTISSNPPNPKTNFRAGDWMRNNTCIGCGHQRHPIISSPADHIRIMSTPSYLAPPMARLSPRFAASAGYSTPSIYTDFSHGPASPAARLRTQSSPGALSNGSPLMPPSPLGLPPSPGPGRHAADGHDGADVDGPPGVQPNVSNDPLSPCIMYWPDNEPLPEQGQIRPSGSAVVSFPPIVNTGNKGAAEKQPGDWVCHKCNYLNWRRRKVCQTCFPYAEGNGDSISTAVQAERIALLENVLATQVGQTRKHVPEALQLPRLGSTGGVSFPFTDSPTAYSPVSPTSPWSAHSEHGPAAPRAPFAAGYTHHSRFDEPLPNPTPIYQTSDGPHDSRPRPHGSRPLPQHRSSLPPLAAALPPRTAPASGSLLPGFLVDIVHSDSPSLSPSTSTSSAELSLDTDEYDDRDPTIAVRGARANTNGYRAQQQQQHSSRLGGASGNASTASLTIHENSIWKMDGAELRVPPSLQSKPANPHPRPHALATGVQGLAAAVASLSIASPARRR
ncbi:uncharacterized protein B0H18DRAFT_956717 [Fomitopsis serialis]|uniref:uncharacterized protein n=1 Tax=Fomitopsis serialis TaxID=139415 RepID=UPI002007B5E8|nr:uncharacterized protein B0H18DRAFT_956717 [Neoantrodia serialis]KAH9921099.1 hypothetical protein B0H18DRAFT_956717 [Neoantrodia serialis]